MHLAALILGSLFGLLIGTRFGMGGAFVGVLLGVFVGYVLAELVALRMRNQQLEKDIDQLKEKLAAVWRWQRELEEKVQAVVTPPPAAAPDPVTSSQPDTPSAVTPPRGTAPPELDLPRSVTPSPPAAQSAGSLLAPAASAWAASNASSDSSGWRATAPLDSRYGVVEPAPTAFDSLHDSFPDIPLFRFIRDYFMGGNTLVRVGVLILFFGVAFLLRYLAEHSHVPIQFRLSAVAGGGVVLLILGWRLRSRRLGYALALQGGGVGILYLTTFAALRLYSLLPPTVAFGLLVAIAAFSAVLAVVQDSQAFAFLAVTGGFLAPILASKGEGSHVVLFSYYAIVNASILAISWYRAWRPLNAVGFVFTFIISTAWGVLHYEDTLFSSTEPFLVLFFLFYVAIGILFSLRQPPQLRDYVDGTLLFGTPIAAFAYQSAMLHQRPVALAWSALVLGTFYFLLAWLLYRGKRASQRLLVDVFMALGVVFVTIAAPLGLNSHKTGATWALEAVALVWVGSRQDRVVGRLFGVLVQIAAGLVLLSNIDQWDVGTSLLGTFVARVLVAVGAIFSAGILRKYAERLRGYEAPCGPILFFFGLLIWMVSGLHQVDRYVPVRYALAAEMGFVGLSALACSELARRTVLTVARLPALWILPALYLLVSFEALSGVRTPFQNGGWLAWLVDFVCLYVILRRHEGDPEQSLASSLHATAGWLVVGVLTWEWARTVDDGVSGHGSWTAVSWVAIPALVLAVLPGLISRVAWPFRRHQRSYVTLFGSVVAAYLALWSLMTNLTQDGDAYPFFYVPVLNALDLAQWCVLFVLARFWIYFRASEEVPESDGSVAPVGALGALGFLWLNAALCRTLHQWAGVPFDFDAMMQSTLVQTALSIFWTVLALATMLAATRRASRNLWLTGGTLLAVTIVKLFVIDLSHVGTVERIVSFVGVGLLTLVIGYFSPLPPAAREHRTA